mmetsp:Transcript_24039/g.62721  ORF Transcript_24039/g.62721 Transcript_24039/m.62721 type:complete len:409 (+) Transcript_24039:134-1360(+)
MASAAADETVMPGSWPPNIAVKASVDGALSHIEPFFFFASSFFFLRFLRLLAPLDSEDEELLREGDLRRLLPRERDRERFFLASFFLSSLEPFLSSDFFFLSFDGERDGDRDRDDEELRDDDDELRDRRRPRDRDGDGVGKSRFNVFVSGRRPIRDMRTADTFLPSNGPSRNTHRCAGFDRPRMRCAAMGSKRYDETNRSTAWRSSLASFSLCCRRRSSRPRRRPRLLLRLRFFFSFFFSVAPNAGGAAPKGNGAGAQAGAGARCVGAKGSTASASGGASSSAFLAFLALAALASLPPRLEPVFFFEAGFLGCAIWPMGTSSSSESSSGFASVACAWSCEMGTSSSSLESFAGAGAGASLSASDADAFRLVTRVPPRRPLAIVASRSRPGRARASPLVRVVAGLDGGP